MFHDYSFPHCTWNFHFQDNSTLKIIRHPPMILAKSSGFPPDSGTKGIQTLTADVEKLVLTPRRCTIMARSLFNINRK
ncbi:hypothetical protein GFC03_06600 [Klebsiella quasivariicola]|nr:hypothetical protein [Klebsiella quasivariicola]